MRELKYYKDLPVRPINKISFPLCLAGADCYIDIEGNKYAFISFRNGAKSPFFSLYLLIKEYNSSGTLIKETKFSVPNAYGRKGLYVIPEPVAIEQDCEGIEVFIQLAEFTNKTFYNDAWTKRGAEKILQAPKVTSTSTVPFEVQPTKEELLRAEKIANGEIIVEKVEENKAIETKVEDIPSPAIEEKPVEVKPEEKSLEEKPTDSSISLTAGSNFYSPREEKPEEVKAEEKPAEEVVAPASAEVKPEEKNVVEEDGEPKPNEGKSKTTAEVLPPVTDTKVFRVKNTNTCIAYPIVLGLALIAGILFIILDYRIVLDAFLELCRKIGLLK